MTEFIQLLCSVARRRLFLWERIGPVGTTSDGAWHKSIGTNIVEEGSSAVASSCVGLETSKERSHLGASA